MPRMGMDDDVFADVRAGEAAQAMDDYRAWTQRKHDLDPDRIKAIVTALDVAFEKNPKLAARSWSYFRHVLGQRDGLALGQELAAADACAWAGYQRFAGDQARTAPIVCVDLIDSPETLMRSQLRSTGRALQLPLAFMPPRYLRCPWLFTTLHHEVGHTLDVDFSVSTGVCGEMPKAGISTTTARYWKQWSREIVCDAFAVLASGPAFVWSLATVLDALDAWEAWELNSVHPPSRLRIEIVLALVDAAGWTSTSLPYVDALVRRSDPAGGPPPMESLRGEVRTIADLVMNATLRGARMKAYASADDVHTIEEAVAKLVRGETPEPLPIRIAPSAAQLAVIHSRTQATRAAASKLVQSAKAPPWTPTDATWADLRKRVEQETRTVGIEDGRKRPPLELLEKHDNISFIGATHHSLAARMETAFAQRSSRRWPRVEVFFTSDRVLERIDTVLVAKKQAACAALRERLAVWAEAWTLYDCDDPYCFASYWDADSDRPDARIHVSPYVWGQDPAICPAVDYVRGREPSQEFNVYRAGLARLRETAPRIASNE
jgi:hypothetical protein